MRSGHTSSWFVLPAVLLAALAAPSRPLAACSTSAQTWSCWETTLPLTNVTCSNLYRDVKVKATFTKLGQPTLTTYAFWDGGNALKVRTAFPASGSWTWSTTCEGGCTCASGLVVSNRSVSVSSYGGTDPLYVHGFPKVSSSGGNAGRNLTYGDATPFFWLGDTAWAGPLRSTAAEWTSYLGNRASRGFSVIQTALPVDWMRSCGFNPTDANGNRPFDQLSGCTPTGTVPNNCSRWNTAFWQNFDQKVQQANDQGFVVALVGLMERVIEGCNNGQAYPALAESQTYARNVAARLSGNFVVFSPGFDRKPESGVSPSTCTPSSTLITCRIRYVGETIAAAAPRHLVTNHWGGSTPSADMSPFQSQSWLAFQMFQSGQAASSANTSIQLQTITQRARQLPMDLWSFSPTKPNMNGESIYDGYTHPTLGSPNYNPYRVRQTAYLSLLSGAFGYSYGSFGVYDWGAFGSTYTAGMARRSNQEMQYLGSFLRGYAWQNLVSQSGRIKNQAPDTQQEKKMVVATDTSTFLLAYLPDNSQIKIRFANLPVSRNGRWFNPRTGAYAGTATGVQDPVDSLLYTYTRPACPGSGDPNCASEPDWLLSLP